MTADVRFLTWQPLTTYTASFTSEGIAHTMWHYNHSTATLNDSTNVESITDVTTGEYEVDFTNPMVAQAWIAPMTGGMTGASVKAKIAGQSEWGTPQRVEAWAYDDAGVKADSTQATGLVSGTMA